MDPWGTPNSNGSALEVVPSTPIFPSLDSKSSCLMVSNDFHISIRTTRFRPYFLGSHLRSGGGQFRRNETAGCHFAILLLQFK